MNMKATSGKSFDWRLGAIGVGVVGLVVLGVRLSNMNRELHEREARLGQEAANTRAAQQAFTAAEAELARLRAEGESLRHEVALLRGRLSGAERPTASRRATGDTALANPATPRDRATAGALPNRQDADMRSYVDSRIGLARERLNLTPEQEEFMRVAVNNALESGLENVRRLRAGEVTYDQVPTLQEWSKALEDQILAGLTPEQQVAYQQHKQEEQRGNARMAANTELMLVQGRLGLTPEQQDAMFAVLYDQSHRGMDTDPQSHVGRPRDPVAAIEWEAALKRQALQGVLTPAQMANYERMQNSYRDLVGRFLRPPTGGAENNAGPPSP
jgi:cell division protein FtsB